MNSAEQELRLAQLEALVDNFPGVAYRCRNDADFTLEYVSGGVELSTGYPLAEFRSHRINYIHLLLPEDVPLAVATIRAEIERCGRYEVTYRIRNAAGEIRWMWDRGVAIREADAIVAIEGFTVDITDRKRMEDALKSSDARLNLALRAARLGTWDWHMVSGEILWSEEHERLWGFARGSFRGTFEEVMSGIHVDDRAVVQQRVQEAIDGQSEYNCEFRVIWPNQTTHWMVGRGTVLYDLNRPVRMIGVTMDITERHQAEAQRQKLEAQLWQAQKLEALGTLAGGVAHDFNNILGIISGNVELARQDVGPDHPAIASLNEIRKAGIRAKNVVQQILAFTRKQVMERRVTSLQTLIEECVAMLKATLPASVNLKVTCSRDAPKVLADANQMHQVLLNLVTNAWHALGNQTGTVEISLERVAIPETSDRTDLHPGEYACMRVSDTGVGMDSDTLARAFEPFYTTKEVGKGSGLGLSVVDGIVKSHDGVIQVRSEPGRGSAFSLYFPAATSEVEFTQTSVLTPASAGRGQTILFLDDDEAIVSLAVKVLERRGYCAQGFTDPTQALQALRADPRQFDLVITDYTMPGMSGLSAARQMMQIRDDLTILLTSGYVTDDLIQRAGEVGVREVVHKPYDFNTLCDIVQKALRS